MLNTSGCILSLEETSRRHPVSRGASAGVYSPRARFFEPHPHLLHALSTRTLQTPRAGEEPSPTCCMPSSQRPYSKGTKPNKNLEAELKLRASRVPHEVRLAQGAVSVLAARPAGQRSHTVGTAQLGHRRKPSPSQVSHLVPLLCTGNTAKSSLHGGSQDSLRLTSSKYEHTD